MAGTYTVQRSTTVQAPAERVYALVADFHQWQRWSPWEDLDPDQERSFSGPASGTGASYAWSGNRKAGKGRMKILEATPPRLVRIALDFEKPFKSSNTTAFLLEPDGSATRVRWTLTGPSTVLTKAMGVFASMDKLIGKDFDKGLARLQAAAESPPA